jgi:hypothetical protein
MQNGNDKSNYRKNMRTIKPIAIYLFSISSHSWKWFMVGSLQSGQMFPKPNLVWGNYQPHLPADLGFMIYDLRNHD